MSDAQEREDWEALLKAPGWLRLLSHAREQWAGNGYGRQVKSAIQRAVQDKEDIAAAVKAIDAASDAVNALVSFPRERIAQLEQAVAHRKAETETLSRRGTL